MVPSLAEDAKGLRQEIASLTSVVAILSGRTGENEATAAAIQRGAAAEMATARKYQHVVLGLAASLMLDLCLTGFLGLTNYHINSYVACQAHYSDGVNARLRVLTDASTMERNAERVRSDALDAFLTDRAIALPMDKRTAQDDTRMRSSYARYLREAGNVVTVHRKADAVRAANPVPPAPSKTCH